MEAPLKALKGANLASLHAIVNAVEAAQAIGTEITRDDVRSLIGDTLGRHAEWPQALADDLKLCINAVQNWTIPQRNTCPNEVLWPSILEWLKAKAQLEIKKMAAVG